MAEQRLIDANELYDAISDNWSAMSVCFLSDILGFVSETETIDPETLPIVRQLRVELENCKQELRQIKYCYDIAKNGEKQLRKQNDKIIASWAECAKKLKQVMAERDAAVKELDSVSSLIDDLVDFVDREIHPVIDYNLYLDLRENVDAVSMFQHEDEWHGLQKEE